MKQIEANIRGKGELVQEYRDYILKEFYRCTQTELEKEDEFYLDLDFSIIQMIKREEYIQTKRREQKAKVK